MSNIKDMNSHSFRPIVGIDLGTTNSAVAYIHNGKPAVISSPRGERIIPSVVLIDPHGKVMVGEDARSALVAMPDRTIAAVKRRMGSNERISLAGQALLPQEISALILKELKSYVDELYGAGEKEAVITVPAYFTDEQRRATKEAGELAGFIVERIINEPTAAALAFGLEHLQEDRHILVYDLGGGTFDVSVVEMMSGLLEVKASTGNSLLGGEDFDWKLVDWFAEQMINQDHVDPRDDLRAKALLKEEAEKVKKRLSSEAKVRVELPLVTVKNNQPVGLTVEVTSEQFVALIDHYLLETMDSLQSVLKDAGLAPSDIDEVLLVGGSTRIPRVHELIHRYFDKAPRTDVNPDEAVALGAAVQAGLKSGALSDSGLIATDVAPFSMGVAVMKEWKGVSVRPGGFAPIIPRNTTIPVTRTESFYTASPGQTSVSVEIYQGENEWVKHNHRLGEFLMEGIPLNTETAEGIDITFKYNLNGILEVASTCISNGNRMSVTVQDALNRHTREAFDESAARLEALWEGTDAENEDEDDDWDDEQWQHMVELLDGEDGESEKTVEEITPTVLHEEAVSLRNRAEKLLLELSGAERRKAQEVVQSLDEAISSGDLDDLQSVIDEATDALIDLEF